MGSANQTRYVDADKLIMALRTIYPATSTSYSSGMVDQQINNLIQQAMAGSLDNFKHQIIAAIEQSATTYDKCMLCVQRDSCIPPDPRLP